MVGMWLCNCESLQLMNLHNLLTLSYSPAGFPARTMYSPIISKLSYDNCTWISLQPTSCTLWWHWLYRRKKHRSSVSWKSCAFTALEPPSRPLRPIFLGDKARYHSPCRLLWPLGHTFFKNLNLPGKALSGTTARCRLKWQFGFLLFEFECEQVWIGSLLPLQKKICGFLLKQGHKFFFVYFLAG